jgi:hypothetical protein
MSIFLDISNSLPVFFLAENPEKTITEKNNARKNRCLEKKEGFFFIFI